MVGLREILRRPAVRNFYHVMVGTELRRSFRDRVTAFTLRNAIVLGPNGVRPRIEAADLNVLMSDVKAEKPVVAFQVDLAGSGVTPPAGPQRTADKKAAAFSVKEFINNFGGLGKAAKALIYGIPAVGMGLWTFLTPLFSPAAALLGGMPALTSMSFGAAAAALFGINLAVGVPVLGLLAHLIIRARQASVEKAALNDPQKRDQVATELHERRTVLTAILKTAKAKLNNNPAIGAANRNLNAFNERETRLFKACPALKALVEARAKAPAEPKKEAAAKPEEAARPRVSNPSMPAALPPEQEEALRGIVLQTEKFAVSADGLRLAESQKAKLLGTSSAALDPVFAEKVKVKIAAIEKDIAALQAALGLVLTGKDAEGNDHRFVLSLADKADNTHLVPNGKLVGSGAMGEVYEAWDEMNMQMQTAIKIVKPIANAPKDLKSNLRARLEGFVMQKEVLAKNPHVIKVYATGETAGNQIIAMEFINDKTLEAELKAKKKAGEHFGTAKAVDWIVQILTGLKAAHSVGVFHRDIKPANIFATKEIRREGETDLLIITDFGLAKDLSGEASDSIANLTTEGSALGTIPYMCPENALYSTLNAYGHFSDAQKREWLARNDLYAVGVMLYELLTNQQPFAVRSPLEYFGNFMIKAMDYEGKVVDFRRKERVPTAFVPVKPGQSALDAAWEIIDLEKARIGEKFVLDQKTIPADLFVIIKKFLAIDPRERFQSSEEAIKALSDFLTGSSETIAAPSILPGAPAAAPTPAEPKTRETAEKYLRDIAMGKIDITLDNIQQIQTQASALGSQHKLLELKKRVLVYLSNLEIELNDPAQGGQS